MNRPSKRWTRGLVRVACTLLASASLTAGAADADFGSCLAQVRSIVAAERLKKNRQTDLVASVRGLIGPGN